MPSESFLSTRSLEHDAEAILARLAVGIDATPESIVAAAQAAALAGPGDQLVLVAVNEEHLATHAGTMAPGANRRLRADTEVNLAAARQLVSAADVVVRSGRLAQALCEECVQRGATLAVVGARPRGRLSALALGGHDADLLHQAPCSLLLARSGWGPHRPSRVVVAVGPRDRHAVGAVSRLVAERLGCDLVPVVGLADAVDPVLLRAVRGHALVDPGSLADAVSAAAGRDCLVVVGWDADRTREIEQVVYGSRCSVLVIRYEGGA